MVNEHDAEHGITAHELANQLPSPEQLLINQQETLQLREIVDTLHPKYKDIIKLHYFKTCIDDDDLNVSVVRGAITAPLLPHAFVAVQY